MNFSPWFREHLHASADGFVWAVQQVPATRRGVRPPKGLGEWSAERHIFHMVFYEQIYALPSMRLWFDEPAPLIEDVDEDIAWGEGKVDFDRLIADFKKVRYDQIALVARVDDAAWNMAVDTVWGLVPLSWVVSKTFQHTAEHTSDVMQIVLFWDKVAAHNRAKSAG